jgi:hypothetical protein
MATNTAAAGAGSVLVFPPRGLEIKGDVSANAWCNAGRAQFDGFARWMDSFTTALAADLAEMMRTEGLDGQTSIGPVSWGSSARAAANKATKPLRAIASEADNIAKMFTVADRQMHAQVFNVIAEVRAARERQQRGSGLTIGA